MAQVDAGKDTLEIVKIAASVIVPMLTGYAGYKWGSRGDRDRIKYQEQAKICRELPTHILSVRRALAGIQFAESDDSSVLEKYQDKREKFHIYCKSAQTYLSKELNKKLDELHTLFIQEATAYEHDEQSVHIWKAAGKLEEEIMAELSKLCK